MPPKFYKSLGNRVTGFKRVSFLTIFSHLLTENGELEDQEIQEIDKKLKADISGETIFEDLVDQIEENVEAVARQNPYTPAQIVSIAFTIVDRSGFYADDCRDWKRKPRSQKRGQISRPTFPLPSRRPAHPTELRRPEAMRPT